MNLQHERLRALCDTLNLPFIAQGYAAAAQDAAKREMAYSDFLEDLLKAEAAGRRVRKQGMLTRLAGFPAIKTLDDFDYAFNLDYARTEKVQFEDDDYYYYVKAVPKITVTAKKVKVKKINNFFYKNNFITTDP